MVLGVKKNKIIDLTSIGCTQQNSLIMRQIISVELIFKQRLISVEKFVKEIEENGKAIHFFFNIWSQNVHNVLNLGS